MAAPAGKLVGVPDDSSSSDEEEHKRFQEAVWEIQTYKTKDGDGNVKDSKRVVVADHEHDGNELQVTQGFQKHVAKKLGHFLDSSISEMEPGYSLSVESRKCNGDEDDDDDGGFRLFSTSVPGQKRLDPPAPLRVQPVPSSSDSDSEMESRLREAAVSARDLLSSSTLASLPSPPPTEPNISEKIKKKNNTKKAASDGEESQVVVKKKKRKQIREESEQVDSAGLAPCAQSNGEPVDSEQEPAKRKRKKKKRQKGNTEGDVLD